jgi:hypothetical protein
MLNRQAQVPAAAWGSRCSRWAASCALVPLSRLPRSPVRRRYAASTLTGCSIFDFASRGGGVVAAMAEAAAAALSPCIVISGEVLIGSREMRTMGIEAGYAVQESLSDRPQGEISEKELAVTARRVARSWSW